MALIVSPTIIFAPMNLIANWFFVNWKLNYVLYLAAFLQFVGGWIRVTSFLTDPGQILPMFLGTLLFFMANPFILNSISMIANTWFADNERARATAIAALMTPIGCLCGLALTGVVAHGMVKDDPTECMQRLQTITYIQNFTLTFFCTLLVVFFKEKPEHPPSQLALTFR